MFKVGEVILVNWREFSGHGCLAEVENIRLDNSHCYVRMLTTNKHVWLLSSEMLKITVKGRSLYKLEKLYV